MNHRSIWTAVACLVLAATYAGCGSSDTGSSATNAAAVTLKQSGKATTFPAAVFQSSTTSNSVSLLLVPFQDTNLCTSIAQHGAKKSTAYIEVDVANGNTFTQSGSPPSTPGNYTTLDGGLVVTSSDAADCFNNGTDTKVQTGSVTFTSVNTLGASGTMDITLADGSTITGAFNAQTCTAASATDSNGSLVCY